MKLRLVLWCTASLMVFVGCEGDSVEVQQSLQENIDSETEIESIPTKPVSEATPVSSSPQSQVIDSEFQVPAYGYTHQRADGNRMVEGKGSFPGAEWIDIQLNGDPVWIVAAPLEEGAIWVASLVDGRVQAFQVIGEDVTPITVNPAQIEQLPPVLRLDGVEATVLVPGSGHAEYSPPVDLDEQEVQAFIRDNGNLSFVDMAGNDLKQLEANALLDSRLLVDGQDRILFLSNPTTRYGHGVLGDEIEASSITLLRTRPDIELALEIAVENGEVVEGIMPLWADLNDDGQREIIVTQSNAESGARIVVYSNDGSRIAEGPPIGQGYRWRHQIAVGPFGPNGETELVDVLTPHIGGVVEYYRMTDGKLEIVASVPGFASHVIGTRNLDMAVGGDFDGDRNLELLVPDQTRNELGGIRRTAEGAEVAWRVPVGGRVVTNLAAVQLNDGSIAVGAGREDGVLRIWLP